MKKRWSILLAISMVLSLLLCGCGSATAKNDTSYYAAGDTAYYEEAESSAAYDAGWNEKMKADAPAGGNISAPMEPAQNAQTQMGSNLPENVKLIYRADIDMESTEFDATVEGLSVLVNTMGGYFERSELNNNNQHYRWGYYTVRVPAANFNAFCEGVGGLCQVNNISRSAEDVSEAYYDIESRLATQKTKLDRLQKLLEQAEVMEDIIELESAISDTELTIEQLTGSLRRYDSLVGYSTISISLAEVYKLTEPEQPVIGFGAKLAAAFRAGTNRFVDNLGDFALGFARAWVGWLIFLIIAAAVILLICRGARRRRVRCEENGKQRRRKKSAAASEATAIPQPTEKDEP